MAALLRDMNNPVEGYHLLTMAATGGLARQTDDRRHRAPQEPKAESAR
jgi:hypothetical protein